MRKLVLAGAALLVAAAATAVWLLLPRDEARPVAAEAAGPAALVYATSGFEEVDALGGARHEYPPRTSIVRRSTGAGCTAFRWRPLEGRVYEWELCGDELRRFTETHRFFGNDDRRTYRCRAGSSFRAGWRCSAGDVTETARVVSAAGDRVRLATTLAGSTTGSGSRELRLRADGVPLRLVVENESATPSFVGPVHYRERYELRLLRPGPSPG